MPPLFSGWFIFTRRFWTSFLTANWRKKILDTQTLSLTQRPPWCKDIDLSPSPSRLQFDSVTKRALNWFRWLSIHRNPDGRRSVYHNIRIDGLSVHQLNLIPQNVKLYKQCQWFSDFFAPDLAPADTARLKNVPRLLFIFQFKTKKIILLVFIWRIIILKRC